MKLEKFKKNKNQKKVIIASVIGLLFIIGAIFLYKTYAYYEEKKTFNVLQGTVPDFNTSDIELSLILDGKKVNNVPKLDNSTNGGYYQIDTDCNDTADISWDIEKWGALITNIRNQKVNCIIHFKSIPKFEVGDYVSYTPSSTSYDIANSLTGMDGYSGSYSNATAIKNDGKQTINPSELNLWRVIRKNDDGTIDMISEYVSSTSVYFFGYAGFKNFVGTLNTIAKQYETEGITSGSRYLGYNGQIENCTSYSSSTDCPTDALYETDTELVKTAVGDLISYNVSSTSTATAYWLASRYYLSSTYLYGRNVNPSGGINTNDVLVYDGSESGLAYAVRPVVTLKSEIYAIGLGTEENPWKVN